MHARWNDPWRRELGLAALAGAAWALLGLALAARGAATASCRVENCLDDGSTNVGSGTLIDATADRGRGLVLTCAHLFTEGVGRVTVEFPGVSTHGANLIDADAAADLAALEIASPPVAAAPLGDGVVADTALAACGFGPAGEFRCMAGAMIGAAESPGQESVKIAGAVRSGDSGGGVFDRRGRLVGVVWGESGGVTYASSGGPLRRFLDRVLARRRAAPLAAASCPNGRCPLVAPGPPSAAPAVRGPAGSGRTPPDDGGVPSGGDCGCGAKWAALAARLEALATPAPRDDVTRGQLAALDDAQRERHESLLARLDGLAPLAGAAGRAAAPALAASLGLGGPAGWAALAAALAGAWFAGRRWKARLGRAAARSAHAANRQQLAPRTAELAAAEEATADADHAFRLASTTETRQPVERDDREARELLRLSQLEGRDPLQDAVAGRLALDRLDAVADGDADPQRARWADALRRELRERFNEIAPTKFGVSRD